MNRPVYFSSIMTGGTFLGHTTKRRYVKLDRRSARRLDDGDIVTFADSSRVLVDDRPDEEVESCP